jgi:hypothetical protein
MGVKLDFKLREECTCRMKVFINRGLRDNVTEGWRGLHKEELHDLYSSTRIIRMIK